VNLCEKYSLCKCSRLPRSTIQPLQRVMNAAARVIMNLSLRDHVKPALKQLHWLPVERRITYKLCLFMHHTHTGQVRQYLSDCVSTVSALSGRYRLSLRSTGSARITFCQEQALYFENEVSPTAAQPPGTLFLPTCTTLLTDTGTFRLKSALFDRTYHCSWNVSYSDALQISRSFICLFID